MDIWKAPKYGPGRQELNWLNSCISSHDFICGCDDPAKHLLILLCQKSGFTEIPKQKCLTSGDDHGDPTEEDIGIGPGDLELLFADHEEDDAG